MAYHCIYGNRECNGCMMCRPDPEPVHCEVCGEEVEYLYKNELGDVLGCDRCVSKVDPYYE